MYDGDILNIDVRDVVNSIFMLYPYNGRKLDWDMLLSTPCEVKVKIDPSAITVEYSKRKLRLYLVTHGNITNFHQFKDSLCKLFSFVEKVVSLPSLDLLLKLSTESALTFDLQKKDMYDNRNNKVSKLFYELVMSAAHYSSTPVGSHKVHASGIDRLVDGEFITFLDKTVYYWVANVKARSLNLTFLPLEGKTLSIEGSVEVLNKYINSVETTLLTKLKENTEWIETFASYLVL